MFLEEDITEMMKTLLSTDIQTNSLYLMNGKEY